MVTAINAVSIQAQWTTKTDDVCVCAYETRQTDCCCLLASGMHYTSEPRLNDDRMMIGMFGNYRENQTALKTARHGNVDTRL